MPRGVNISLQEKLDINQRRISGRSPLQVWQDQFFSDNSRISVSTIEKFYTILNLPPIHPKRINFLTDPKLHLKTGRRLKLTYANSSFLMNIVRADPNMKVKVFHHRYLNTVPNDPLVPFRAHCLATTYKYLHRANWANLVPERRHMMINYADNVAMLRHMRLFHPNRIVAMDGMNCNTNSFKNKKAWGPRGMGAPIVRQFVINGITYSVLSAYTIYGFLDWMIIVGTTTGDDMETFLRRLSRRIIRRYHVAFLDNASVNRTVTVRNLLNVTFEGFWLYNGRYSPQLNPVERGISNIRSYITARENMQMNAIDLINAAFHHYSDATPEGRAAAPGNWNVLVNNYNNYINGLII